MQGTFGTVHQVVDKLGLEGTNRIAFTGLRAEYDLIEGYAPAVWRTTVVDPKNPYTTTVPIDKVRRIHKDNEKLREALAPKRVSEAKKKKTKVRCASKHKKAHREKRCKTKTMQHRHPRATVIATSAQFGAGVRRSWRAARDLGAWRLIAKPFSREELLGTVRAAVGPAR